MAYQDARQVCSPWADPADLCACQDETVDDCETGTPEALTYPWTDAELILAASNILYGRTCYQFPGLCEREIYPCVCCDCTTSPCGCGVYRAVPLASSQQPVNAIVSVHIDGDALDPSAYRLDDYSRLVRIDGERWPCCNALDLPNAVECQTMRVVFNQGTEPPQELKMAAVELACQMKRACETKPCSLDKSFADRISSISRRGTSFQVEDVVNLTPMGLFGNAIIDHAVHTHENCGGSALVDPVKRWRARGVQVNTQGFIP